MAFERILVRGTNWVGDAVMSVAALQLLRTQFPKAHISILARPWVSGLYRREPFCDEMISYDVPPGAHGFWRKWLLAKSLRQRSFDCAILFPNSFESAAVVRLAKIPVRIGYATDGRGLLLTDAPASPKHGEIPPHQRFRYLELLKRAGLISGYPLDSPIRLAGASEAAAEGRKEFARAGLSGPVIGVAPGAAYGGAKRWLADRFAESAVTIANERKAGTIAVFGSKDEAAICETVHERILQSGLSSVNFAGATDLSQFMALAAACELMITNDSGPMHVASALGVPTVAIFGATDETATGPIGKNARVVRVPVECSPCLLRECPIDHRCMSAVSATAVASEALQLLASEGKR